MMPPANKQNARLPRAACWNYVVKFGRKKVADLALRLLSFLLVACGLGTDPLAKCLRELGGKWRKTQKKGAEISALGSNSG